jgi:acylphosphatase
MDARIRARVVVHGRVQGVFFRDTVRRRSLQQNLAGSVRNCRNGTVEAVFEGAREDVESLVDFCRLGPRGAEVERLERFDETPEGLSGFTVA